MNLYLKLKSDHSGYTTTKNLRVVHGSWEPVVVRPGQPVRKWDGSLSMPIGGNYQVWRGVLRMYNTETDTTNFWTFANLKTMLTSTALDHNALTLTDYDGSSPIKVAFVGDFAPKNQTPILDGVGSFWLVPVQFEFRES